MTAFVGDAAVRDAALQRLQQHLEAGRLTGGAMFWNDTQASIAAALVDSGEPQRWEATLGLPRWMAYALDLGTSQLPPQQGVSIAAELLQAIAVGSDTTALAGAVLEHLLNHLLSAPGAQDPSKSQGVLTACREILALHQRALRGDHLTAKEWRAARQRATAATNEARDEAHAAALGACVEAAAWDPLISPTTVGEVLRLYGSLGPAAVDARFGWTEADTAHIKSMLDKMFNTYIKNHPEETRDVFMLLREHHPADEARLLSYTQSQNAERIRFAKEGARMLVDVVGRSAR